MELLQEARGVRVFSAQGARVASELDGFAATMRALRSLTLLLALAGSSAMLFSRGQKRRRELRGARLLGAMSGGVAGFHFSSEAAAVRRVVYTAPQQAALVSMAALAGLCFTEVVAHQEHGVARGLRRVGLWVAEVRSAPRQRPPPTADENIPSLLRYAYATGSYRSSAERVAD